MYTQYTSSGQATASSVSFHPRLSPCKRFDRDILLHLSTRRIIAVDPNSEEESFAFDDDGKPSEYWPDKVRWRLCDLNPKSFVTRLEELVARRTFPASPTSPLKVTIISEAVELSKQGQQRPLLSYLAGLSAADRAQVAAVMLIGREDEDPSNFEDIVRRWTRPLDGLQPEYLAGKRRLWQFLEKGLEELTRTACC